MRAKKGVTGMLGLALVAYALAGTAADRVEVGPGPLWESGVINHIDYKGGIVVVDDSSYQIASNVVVMKGRSRSVGIDNLEAGMAIQFRLAPNVVSGGPLISQIRSRR